jgi:fructose-1-phosphate kinase PfkB-like protein
MSTLAEIERAADALPVQEQEILLRHLSQKLAQRDKVILNPVPPPDVPKEELQRIHALIEAEFSRVNAEGW